MHALIKILIIVYAGEPEFPSAGGQGPTGGEQLALLPLHQLQRMWNAASASVRNPLTKKYILHSLHLPVFAVCSSTCEYQRPYMAGSFHGFEYAAFGRVICCSPFNCTMRKHDSGLTCRLCQNLSFSLWLKEWGLLSHF